MPDVAWIVKGRSRMLVGKTLLALLLRHWRAAMRHREGEVLLLLLLLLRLLRL